MLAKQPFARRIVIAFTLMTLIVSGLFSLGIVGIVHSVEEHLVSEELDRELNIVLQEIGQGLRPRLDSSTRFFATSSIEFLRVLIVQVVRGAIFAQVSLGLRTKKHASRTFLHLTYAYLLRAILRSSVRPLGTANPPVHFGHFFVGQSGSGLELKERLEYHGMVVVLISLAFRSPIWSWRSWWPCHENYPEPSKHASGRPLGLGIKIPKN